MFGNKDYYDYMKKELKPYSNDRKEKESSKELITMRYVDYVYDIVKADTEEMDAIYKDYIIQMVGVYGFNALYEAKLIEGCGVMNGRYLYVLCPKPYVEPDKNYQELLEENKKLKEIIMKGEL